jgi:acetyl/propionyl-CoA carboxylase alpha subunit
MRLRYQAGRAVLSIQLERQGSGYRIDLDGRSHDVILRRSDGPFLDLLVDGRPVEAIVVSEGERRIVKIGDAEPLTLTLAGRNRRGAAPVRAADGRLTAAMDGQVVAVAARPGERVEAGETLAVLEAMKMEIRVVAPFSGRVLRVLCKTGDVVERGRVLIEIETDPEGPTPT